MTATLDVVPKKSKEPPSAELVAARELVRQAREQGLSFGPDPRRSVEAVDQDRVRDGIGRGLTEHVGHDKHSPSESGNVRNGARSKTVLSDVVGHVEIDVPRDRAGSTRRSCASANAACPGSTRSCCRCTRRG
ncbi:MAG: transposase [Ilumatobacteraceae bacterium]